MLRVIFDREGIGVSLLAFFNLSLGTVNEFIVKLSGLNHFLLDVGQVLVAFATATYFVVKTIKLWKRKKTKNEKVADRPAGPDTNWVRDADSEES